MASTKLLIGVFILDLIAFALAVAAELKRSTATIVQDGEFMYNYCVYDSDIATNYGIDAALFLMASQVLIMEASQCLCFRKVLSPQGSRAKAIVLHITCWVSFIIAEACLLCGAVQNVNHTKFRTIFGQDMSCQTLRKGVFGAGATFILFNGISSILYHFYDSKAKESLQTDIEDTTEKLGDYTALPK